VILGLLGVSYVAVSRLTAPALEWMDELPQALREAKPKLASLREPVDQVTKAAKSIEEAAGDSDESGAIEVVERGPGLSGRVLAHLGAGAQGAFVAGFLLFFLLSDGVSFLGGFLGVLSGRRDRRLGRAVARSVEAQIARYVATITLINAALGACVGLAMNLLGVPNPALWGVLVALLNFVPYVGAVIGITVLGAVALVTFDTPVRIVLPPLIYFLLNGLEGMLITPMIIGKRWLVRPALVFLWLVLWSWLWGIPGALLATPMLVAFKITCDALPMLRPVAAVLGREERDPIEDGGGRAVAPGPGESA
jgi:predicted PurR-regulated permease PerM